MASIMKKGFQIIKKGFATFGGLVIGDWALEIQILKKLKFLKIELRVHACTDGLCLCHDGVPAPMQLHNQTAGSSVVLGFCFLSPDIAFEWICASI